MSLDFGSFLGLGGSVGGFVQVTGASSVCQLKGPGVSLGASGGEGIVLGRVKVNQRVKDESDVD